MLTYPMSCTFLIEFGRMPYEYLQSEVNHCYIFNMFIDIQTSKEFMPKDTNKIMTYEIFKMNYKKKTNIIRIEHNRIGSSYKYSISQTF